MTRATPSAMPAWLRGSLVSWWKPSALTLAILLAGVAVDRLLDSPPPSFALLGVCVVSLLGWLAELTAQLMRRAWLVALGSLAAFAAAALATLLVGSIVPRIAARGGDSWTSDGVSPG